MITVFESTAPIIKQETKSSAVLVNPSTNTFEFVIQKKVRACASESLTLQDRRELAKTRLNNEAYFVKAKAVYAAGGGINEIRARCGGSLSYAEKVHAAFERACK